VGVVDATLRNTGVNNNSGGNNGDREGHTPTLQGFGLEEGSGDMDGASSNPQECVGNKVEDR
jgi:hypothetical protein